MVPQVRAAFTRLGFPDPTGALLDGIARYRIDAAIEGIEIVEAGASSATVDGRQVRRYHV